MYPAQFDGWRRSLDEALRLLAEGGGDAKILAGGHSLLPMMKPHRPSPSFVDLRRVPAHRDKGARRWCNDRRDGDSRADRRVWRSAAHAVLSETAEKIEDMQVRNRGTLGEPGSCRSGRDLPATFLALDGEVVCRGSGGDRTIKAADFFVDILTTARRKTKS